MLVSQQSIALGTAPMYRTRAPPPFSMNSGSLLIRAPPITVPWPLMNLVVLWTTTSAPRERGLWRIGVANVLSTTTLAPCECAISEVLAMSITDIVGLAGVSM